MGRLRRILAETRYRRTVMVLVFAVQVSAAAALFMELGPLVGFAALVICMGVSVNSALILNISTVLLSMERRRGGRSGKFGRSALSFNAGGGGDFSRSSWDSLEMGSPPALPDSHEEQIALETLVATLRVDYDQLRQELNMIRRGES